MHACPRCWEVIEHQALVGDGAAEASILHEPTESLEEPTGPTYEEAGTEAVAVPHLPEQTVQIVTEPAHGRMVPVIGRTTGSQTPIATIARPGHERPARRMRGRKKRRIRLARLVLIGLVGGLLVAVGLVALEVFVPEWRGTLPDQVKLVREAFPDGDFAINVPEGWDVRNEDVDGKPGVAVFEPVGAAEDDRLRRFNIVGVTRSFDSARVLAEDHAPASARDYEEIDITDGLRLDGRRAFRHRYTDGDEYREEWWVQRGDGTHRIEFASPVSRREESAILFVRIARTFDVL